MRDDNSVPPTYVLQPISSLLPDFKSPDADRRSEAKNAWYDDNTIMQDAIVPAACLCLDKVKAHEYEMSGMEYCLVLCFYTFIWSTSKIGITTHWYYSWKLVKVHSSDRQLHNPYSEIVHQN